MKGLSGKSAEKSLIDNMLCGNGTALYKKSRQAQRL